jgi:hypothetical protein
VATVKISGVGLIILYLATGYSPWPAVSAIAVEYELDNPLDLKQKWGFVRRENFFVQHQCGEERGKAEAARIEKLLQKELNFPESQAGRLLQVRLWPGHDAYRRAFKFSKDRHAHYGEHLNLITSYCGTASDILEEHLILYRLSAAPLRPWQKIFLAEILPYLENKSGINPFPDTARNKPKPLGYVLLSNHRPEKPERASLRRLALFLQKNKKLEEFILALLNERRFDDTGVEILEKMFPEGLKILEEKITPPDMQKTPNNTLPGRK